MPTNLPKKVAALCGRLAVLISLRQPPHAPRRLDRGRSVPLPVALGGDDYAFVPPAVPFSGTDRLCMLFVLKNSPAFLKEQGSIFRAFRVEIFTLAHIFRLHNEVSDATLRKWKISLNTLNSLVKLVRQKPL